MQFFDRFYREVVSLEQEDFDGRLQRVREELMKLTTRPGAEMVRGAGGIAEGMPEHFREAQIPKFRDDGLWLVHAGGGAGLFSAVIGGWVNGSGGSIPVTREVRT
jgi:hypothetical protein